MKAVAFTAEVEAWAKGHWRAMFQLCSRFRQRSSKAEFNSSMMTRSVASGFEWRRREEKAVNGLVFTERRVFARGWRRCGPLASGRPICRPGHPGWPFLLLLGHLIPAHRHSSGSALVDPIEDDLTRNGFSG